MSWYRKHRPRTVASLHLTQVREALQQFMDHGHIPQVLLFAGPKGTGKTSSARILGAMLNDPANEAMVDAQFFGRTAPKKKRYVEPAADSAVSDLIFTGNSFIVQEMDAASHRGIDDIRALKERVALPPQVGKMTVYILDEAHMLTTEAFNALLKLLEEPPAHAVFILATTELHKIPETIKSRCSLVQFRRADTVELMAALKSVLDLEQLTYQDEALAVIAEYADGSFRDAVKLAELAVVDGAITTTSVQQSLQTISSQELTQLVDLVVARDAAGIASWMVKLRSTQIEEKLLMKSLLSFLHRCLLQHLGVEEGTADCSREVALFLLKEISQLPLNRFPAIPHLQLELKLLELVERSKHKQAGPASGNSAPPTPTPSASRPDSPSKKKKSATAVADDQPAPPARPAASGDSNLLLSKWSELLQAVKQKNITLEALLRSAKPLHGINGTAQVAVYYRFHKEQLEHPKFKALIDQCAIPLAGGSVKLEYILSEVPVVADLVELPKENSLAELAEEVLI